MVGFKSPNHPPTTMTCPKTHSKEQLKMLYQNRWNVELDIRHIKDTMGMNILSFKHCPQLWLAWMQHATTLDDENRYAISYRAQPVNKR